MLLESMKNIFGRSVVLAQERKVDGVGRGGKSINGNILAGAIVKDDKTRKV